MSTTKRRRKREFKMTCERCHKTESILAFDRAEAMRILLRNGVRFGICSACRAGNNGE